MEWPDCIVCKYPLPNPEAQDFLFQTKDLSRTVERYTLTKEGRLILPRINTDGETVSFYADMDTFYHGTLTFYGKPSFRLDEAVIFKAHFWEGQLTSIEEVPATRHWWKTI